MKTASTEFKNLEGIVFEISLVADAFNKEESMDIKSSGDYFYSNMDKKVHKSTSWIQYYYYDKSGGAHSHEQVYKILATSDNKKFPELPLLTVFDLAR